MEVSKLYSIFAAELKTENTMFNIYYSDVLKAWIINILCFQFKVRV